MQKGNIVTIYQKPFTQEDCEGKAKLRKCLIEHNPEMEYWEVEFIQNFDKDKKKFVKVRFRDIVERWIKKET